MISLRCASWLRQCQARLARHRAAAASGTGQEFDYRSSDCCPSTRHAILRQHGRSRRGDIDGSTTRSASTTCWYHQPVVVTMRRWRLPRLAMPPASAVRSAHLRFRHVQKAARQHLDAVAPLPPENLCRRHACRTWAPACPPRASRPWHLRRRRRLHPPDQSFRTQPLLWDVAVQVLGLIKHRRPHHRPRPGSSARRAANARSPMAVREGPPPHAAPPPPGCVPSEGREGCEDLKST